jgi:hypothetical protein
MLCTKIVANTYITSFYSTLSRKRIIGSKFCASCHERQLQGLGRKAKVEGSQLRLYKAKEGSRKHEAAHA